MARPTVGVAFICNVASAEFGRAIESVAPHVDQLVVVDTSLDGALASLNGTRMGEREVEVFPLQDRSILAEDGMLLHFAAARNESFAHLRTEWAVWMDADDTVRDGGLFRDLAAEAPEDTAGYWLPYEYAHDQFGHCITVLARERLVRLSVGWRWDGRVHETLTPLRPVHWEKRDAPAFIHADGHRNRSARNLRLLALMLAEEPDNIRVWKAMADQHFANREWAQAVAWYRKFFTDPRGFHLERWQAMVYAAKALRELGAVDDAIRLDMAAMQSHPHLADPYLGLALAYMQKCDPAKAKEWAELALLKERPADLVFVNPLDYRFHPLQVLSVANAALGDMERAIAAADDALAERPGTEEVAHNRALWEGARARQTQVGAYCLLAAGLSDSDRVRAARGQGDGFHREEAVRDVWVPAQMRLAKRGTQPEAAIVCGHTVQPWTALTPAQTGIGGSETAVVEVTRRMARVGWRVTVYGRPEELEGWYDGVGYVDAKRWRVENPVDLLIGWRNPALPAGASPSARKWLWLHDLHSGPRSPDQFAQWEAVYGVSRFHADYLVRQYPTLAGKVGVFPNGIDLARFQGELPRQRYKCVYTSSPDRGLLNLLRIWPALVTVEPVAELHVFYGWENLDAQIAAGDAGAAAFKASVLPLFDQPGVVWRGRVSQKELARELLSSDLLLYPTSFLETFGINVVEAMAAGLFPVTSRCGAIPEVVGDAYPLVPGVAGSDTYNRQWLGLAMAFLVDVRSRAQYYRRGVERAALWTWDRSFAEAWLPALKEAVPA